MLLGDSMRELIEAEAPRGLADLLIADQAEADGVSPQSLRAAMAERWKVMAEAAQAGLDPTLRSVSGLTGGMAAKVWAGGGPAGGARLAKVSSRALAVAEYNACMGRIVAAPTAGACGILPAVLLTVQEEQGFSDSQMIDALFCAGGVGRVIDRRASLSGAAGGCQAECGSAAAMAAAALVTLFGGTAAMAGHAVAFALMNTMGLVCDPVRGLVEVPCVFRNVLGATLALSCADMALAGVESPLPADEVIDAMRQVGDAMPTALRETGEGGCAACPSACKRPVPSRGE